jgi:hypothetical protein
MTLGTFAKPHLQSPHGTNHAGSFFITTIRNFSPVILIPAPVVSSSTRIQLNRSHSTQS